VVEQAVVEQAAEPDQVQQEQQTLVVEVVVVLVLPEVQVLLF
jgi:hypothetical protein